MRDELAGRAPGCADDDVRDLLPALLHGRLAGAERARVEAHVAACAGCAAELALLRDVHGAVVAGAPRLDLDAVAAAVRAATVPLLAPGRRLVPAAAPLAPAWAAGAARAPGSRWRGARTWRALAATVLVAAGTAGVWLARRPSADGAGASTTIAAGAPATGVTAPGRRTDDTVALATAPASASVRPPVAPPVLASADPALGARFDDLTDAELQAVLDAIDEDEGGLPSAEPEAAAPAVAVGGA